MNPAEILKKAKAQGRSMPDKPPKPDPRGNPYGSTDLDMETLRAMALNLKGAKPYRAYRYDSE